MKYRNIDTVSRAERATQMWLNIDDVLSHVPVARSKLYKMIDENEFPAPYKWRGTPLWPQSDIRHWINQCVANQLPKKADKNPITWDAVKEFMAQHSPRGLTNKQIAHALNTDESDTTNLTRLMAKAGVLCVFKPLRGGAGEPNFYVFNNGDIEVP